ncbi:hypothetical protein ACJX0J_011616, partial [Zea mays]
NIIFLSFIAHDHNFLYCTIDKSWGSVRQDFFLDKNGHHVQVRNRKNFYYYKFFDLKQDLRDGSTLLYNPSLLETTARVSKLKEVQQDLLILTNGGSTVIYYFNKSKKRKKERITICQKCLRIAVPPELLQLEVGAHVINPVNPFGPKPLMPQYNYHFFARLMTKRDLQSEGDRPI